MDAEKKEKEKEEKQEEKKGEKKESGNAVGGQKRGREGKKGKKTRMAFDTPYTGVGVAPAAAEAQSAALAALSRLAHALPGRRALARVLLVGANAVCRVVEAPGAAAAVAAVCVSAPPGTPPPGTPARRSAFGVGTAGAVLARHIALCCAQQHVPVAVLSETDSAALGRVAGLPSALAFALRAEPVLAAAAPPLPAPVRALAATVAARLAAAQAAVAAPWLAPGFADGLRPLRVAPCLENPAREPQRLARRKAQQQQKKKGKTGPSPSVSQQQKQPQPPPAKKAR